MNPNRSVFSDHIVCLEDGKKYASLTKHLRVTHGLTPDEYRSKWRLPSDYPMAAPDYAALRSKNAKDLGLGDKGRAALAAAAQEAKPQRRHRLRDESVLAKELLLTTTTPKRWAQHR